MKTVQEYTAVLSARLIDTRSRRQAERTRDEILRERRETKETMKYADFIELRASALAE
jgi:hypothetical protein